MNIPQEQQAANLFGEGSLLAQIVEALENVRQAREAVTNADVAVQAVDEQKRADEREKTQREMNEKIKLDIKNESNLYTDQTELLRGDLKKAADSALATFSKVLPEITKQFTVASDKAQSDYDVAAKIAEREALEYINSDQNKARKHPVTLETNPAYKAKLLELDRERLIALDKALEARDRSLKALEMQVEMEDKILGLQKSQLDLTVQGAGVYQTTDYLDRPEAVIQSIKSEREIQEQMAFETNKFLLESGKYTKEQAVAMMELLTGVSYEDARGTLGAMIQRFGWENEEIALNLEKFLNSAEGKTFEFQRKFVIQMRERVAQIKQENINLGREQEIYKKTMNEFSEFMINLEVKGGGPLAQITNKLLSDSFQLASQRRRLEGEKSRIEAEIALQKGASGLGTVTPELLAQQEMVQESITGIDKKEKINVDRAIIESERALGKLRAQLALIRIRDRDKELKITKEQNKYSEKQLNLENQSTLLQEKRSRGVSLTAKETKKIIELEKEMEESGFAQRRAEAAQQSSLALQEQLNANQVAGAELLRLAIAEGKTQEEINKIKSVTKDIAEELSEAAIFQLGLTQRQIDAEEKLAKTRRRQARDRGIEGSGLFNLGSLNEGQRDVANQFLKEPRLQAAIALFDEQRDFTNKGAERGLNLQSLMNRTDDSFLKEALRLLIIGSEEVAERQADVAESIAENNMKLSNQMQGLTDASASASATLENSVKRTPSLIEAYLNAESDKILQEQRLNQQVEIERRVIEQGISNRNSDAFRRIVSNVANENAESVKQARKAADQLVLDFLRDEYRGLQSSEFDLFGASSSQLKDSMQFLTGLGGFVDLEKDIKTIEGGNVEESLRGAVARQKQILTEASEAMREGNLKEAQSLQGLAEYYDTVINRLQVLSENYGIYNNRQRESLKNSLKIEREQTINGLQDAQRQQALEFEIINMRKEGYLTEEEMAERIAQRRKEIITAQIADQKEILALQHESAVSELATQYSGQRYTDELELLQARFEHENQILDIQQRQQHVSVDSTEQMRKLNKELDRSATTLQKTLSKILEVYFKFLGEIFGSIFDAIFGDEEENKQRQKSPLGKDKVAELEKQNQQLDQGMVLKLDPKPIEDLRDSNIELMNAVKDYTEQLVLKQKSQLSIGRSAAAQRQSGMGYQGGSLSPGAAAGEDPYFNFSPTGLINRSRTMSRGQVLSGSAYGQY